MSRLCFGTYAKILQKVIKEPNGNKNVVELLFGLITDNEEITNQLGEPFVVTDKIASDLLGFKENVRKKIKDASNTQQIIDASPYYFEEVVIPEIMPDLIANLLSDLTELISSDSDVPQSKQDELLVLANEATLADFLSSVFLYALKKPNKQLKDGLSAKVTEQLTLTLNDINKLQEILSRVPRPAGLEIPEELESDELTYVTELLTAYADAEGIVLPKESLTQYPKYKADFERRRKDYYAAETIRRGSRDVFGKKDPDQFDVLKDETYDGVIDVHSQDFPHGFARLNKVMAQAATIRVDKCLLSRLPDWIGASEKKGVCHILVNDRRIQGWVANDE